MGQREALDETLAALVELGRFEPVDAAMIEMCRGLADQLDEGGSAGNSQMWAQYRETLGVLLAGGDSSDAFAALVAELSTKIRDASPEGAGD